MNELNNLIMVAHWRNNNHMRADTKYLEMTVTGNCDNCGEDLSKMNPTELHASFDYTKFLCDDCYEKHVNGDI